jgi:hypothetical protein
MSNYTTENLTPAIPVPGVPAIRIGDQVFTMVTSGGGGSATDFYKCASVDTVNHTWTGYKAVLSGGYYTFEQTATSGLVYSTITPEVGKVYSEDAKVVVDYLDVYIPEPYASIPFTSDYVGTVNGTSVDFVSGASGDLYFSGNRLGFQGGSVTLTGITTSLLSGDFTIFFRINNQGYDRAAYLAGVTDCYLGIDDNGGHFNMWAGNGSSWNILQADYSGQADSGTGSISTEYNTDTSLIMVHDGDFWRLFVNGQLSVEKERTGTIGSGDVLRLGTWGSGYGFDFYGQLWDFRLYQSALSSIQITRILKG